MGPVGPCRSPGGLERSLLMELPLRSAPLSILHRDDHTHINRQALNTKVYSNAQHINTAIDIQQRDLKRHTEL